MKYVHTTMKYVHSKVCFTLDARGLSLNENHLAIVIAQQILRSL